jgi:hypothetical protein
MRRSLHLVFAVATAGAFFVSESSATDRQWLSVKGAASCLPGALELEGRIASLVAGAPNPRLAIRVTLDAEGPQTVAVVELLASMRVIGRKRLVSSSCDEALRAVVSVAALAMSSSSDNGLGESARSSAREAGADDSLTTPSVQPVRWQSSEIPSVERDAVRTVESEKLDPNRTIYRLLGSAGIDWGTLGEPVGLLGAGGAWVSGRSALLGMGWYGITSQRVEEGPDTYYRESSYVGALTLDYCHGLSSGHWISACAGAELGWLVFSREEREKGGLGVEKYHSNPTFAPRLGSLLGLRAGPIQPEIGLFAQVPALGRAPRGQRLALRATLGAAVQF